MKNYISYFTQCYIADNKSTGLLNFNTSKYEHQHFIKGSEELANKTLPFVYIKTDYAEKVNKTLALYEGDKELWYGSVFIVSKYKAFNSKTEQKISAPLFLFKAIIKEVDEDYFLEIDFDSFQINSAVLKKLNLTTSFTELIDDLNSLWKTHSKIDDDFIINLEKILQTQILDLESDLALFPTLLTSTGVRKAHQENPKVVSASGLFVSSKINNTNAVVNELQALEEAKEFSGGLKAFFSHQPKLKAADDHIQITSPILLNTSQLKAAKNAHQYNKSIIYGPPGTGKTHTITSIALDFVSKKKSVLIVSQTDQALDVLRDKLKKTAIKDFVIKSGGRYAKRSIKSKLMNIINGFYIVQSREELMWSSKLQKQTALDELAKLEYDFKEKTIKEINRVETYLGGNYLSKMVNEVEISIIRSFEEEEWNVIDSYFKHLDAFNESSKTYLKYLVLENLKDYAENHLRDIIKLNNSIEKSNRSDLFQVISNINFEVLSGVFPVWLSKIDQISENIPLQKDLFDLVIVDEATQCNIASCLPIFQRAKKIIVAGDQNQLRHISFLSQNYMDTLLSNFQIEDKLQFNYRKKSLLDFCIEGTSTVDQVTLLDEHFRSLPDIIKFSNRQFYDNRLRIMTQTPENNSKKSLFLHEVNGKREVKSSVNKAEAKLMLKKIRTVIEAEVDKTSRTSSSIGVLSPFSEQTKYLSNQISENFSLKEIRKHKIKIGSPYHFQGDERDFMYISLSIDDKIHHSSLRYLEKADVFNVSITRAKREQHVFKSFHLNSIPKTSLITDFIESIEEDIPPIDDQVFYEDDFVKEVCEFLTEKGYHVFPGFEIAGLKMDILVEKDGKYKVIDLIGYPGPCQDAFSIERYKILHRIHIPIIPLSYISWMKGTHKIKNVLLKLLERK